MGFEKYVLFCFVISVFKFEIPLPNQTQSRLFWLNSATNKIGFFFLKLCWRRNIFSFIETLLKAVERRTFVVILESF